MFSSSSGGPVRFATSSQRSAYQQALANQLFDGASRAARWHLLWSSIAGLPGRLQVLADAQGAHAISAIHFAGARIVPIAQIRGSENERVDFDAEFRPLNGRVRERWLSIAQALADGVPLPPVELIQLGDSYFVRDGHHRISVARAMGQEVIDAEVTVLQVSAWSAVPAVPKMQTHCASCATC